ncbi:MAG: hypothetical protein AVDCRST_MAG39-699, partial [uncultured Sphingomonadaceae bacterium]
AGERRVACAINRRRRCSPGGSSGPGRSSLRRRAPVAARDRDGLGARPGARARAAPREARA